MRIIAGELRGRQFEAPRGHRTHPMAEKVRGALFNALGDIEGLTVLDALTGSGALSFEAISHGAKQATAVDIDKKAILAVKNNAKALGMTDKIKAIRANVGSWSDNNQDQKFDIVFAAPPYDDLQQPLLGKLVKHTKISGLYVLDWPGKLEVPQLDSLKIIEQKKYGDAQLVFYRRVA